MRTNSIATSIVSGYGIKPVVVDGQVLATVLKLQVKRNSFLHTAYKEVFQKAMKPLFEDASVCKDSSMIRLYYMEKGAGSDLLRLYREAQVRVRELEIAQLKELISPSQNKQDNDLPF
jgi:hypothetical protein